jgi:hypothetical protein
VEFLPTPFAVTATATVVTGLEADVDFLLRLGLQFVGSCK